MQHSTLDMGVRYSEKDLSENELVRRAMARHAYRALKDVQRIIAELRIEDPDDPMDYFPREYALLAQLRVHLEEALRDFQLTGRGLDALGNQEPGAAEAILGDNDHD